MQKIYRIVGEPDTGYQIIECFGDYRISKKRFKKPADAYMRILKMGGELENKEILR